MKRPLLKFVALTLLLGGVGQARAGVILGTVYQVSNAQAEVATPAEIAALSGSTPSITFTTNQINFDSRVGSNNRGNYTYSSFLNSQGSITTFGTAMNGFNVGDQMDVNGTGGLFDFNGSAFFTTGETFSLTHDDGFTFLVNGQTVVSQPGPTAPNQTNFTYTGPTGTFNWEIVYGESDGPPAVLQVLLPGGAPLTTVPEPASLTMLGIGMFGLMGYGWRRRRNVIA